MDHSPENGNPGLFCGSRLCGHEEWFEGGLLVLPMDFLPHRESLKIAGEA